MRSGMLGMAVLTAAIVGTIILGWALSTDVYEEEVTRYNPLADITGEFDTERSPDYIEYDPISNYTGYYTAASNGYFDGVNYTQSSPNNYRLNLQPTMLAADNYNVDSIASSESFYLDYWFTESGPMTKMIGTPKAVTIPELATALGYSNYDQITITNAGNTIDYSDLSGAVLFIYSAMGDLTPGSSNNIAIKNPSITTEINPHYPTTKWSYPILAATYNNQTKQVQLYSDNDLTQPVGVYTPSQVYLLYGTRGGAPLELGVSVYIESYDIPDSAYMDPSQGVTLS